jgi:SAM-dependent methyltransferase
MFNNTFYQQPSVTKYTKKRFMSPHGWGYLRYTWEMLNGFRVHHEQGIAQLRIRDIAPYLPNDQRLTVLDLANGQLRPQFMLLQSQGHNIFGIDQSNRPAPGWSRSAYAFARQLYRWRGRLPNTAATANTLICGDVGSVPLPSNSFDLITSIAAFEHFLDVPAIIAEMHRILRPGGLAWVCIHLFTCPSGGHNLGYVPVPMQRMPRGIEPWDHLRRRRIPFSVPLNEWRRDQYLSSFADQFEIMHHYCAMREGEAFLTPELASELCDYSQDELTTMAYVIVARKR